jgi:hypothetical protein
MVLLWKIVNNKVICDIFGDNSLKSVTANIPLGYFDVNGTFTHTEYFQHENINLHTWNIEIFIKLSLNLNDIYFSDNTDYLVVNNIDSLGCGFLFDDNFEEYLEELVIVNDPKRFLFSMIDGTYVYDNRIVIITNNNFNDIYKLSTYSKKLTISPFRLNRENSPYNLLKNYIFFTLPTLTISNHTKKQISGGLIRCNSTGFYQHLYEYDINAFYPNIIVKYLADTEPIKILMKPLIDDSLKCLKLFLFGMLGSKYSNLYNPDAMDLITTIGRTIISKYENRAIIVATDAIFMTYPIIPDFENFTYKTKIHDDVFVISASQYFTKDLYKGFPKNKLSDHVHFLLNQLMKSVKFENTLLALVHFMSSLNHFPLLPIPLKNGQQVTAIIKDIDSTSVDKYTYLLKYRKIIYNVCEYNSIKKIKYEEFKFVYNYFMY